MYQNITFLNRHGIYRLITKGVLRKNEVVTSFRLRSVGSVHSLLELLWNLVITWYTRCFLYMNKDYKGFRCININGMECMSMESSSDNEAQLCLTSFVFYITMVTRADITNGIFSFLQNPRRTCSGTPSPQMTWSTTMIQTAPSTLTSGNHQHRWTTTPTRLPPQLQLLLHQEPQLSLHHEPQLGLPPRNPHRPQPLRLYPQLQQRRQWRKLQETLELNSTWWRQSYVVGSRLGCHGRLPVLMVTGQYAGDEKRATWPIPRTDANLPGRRMLRPSSVPPAWQR